MTTFYVTLSSTEATSNEEIRQEAGVKKDDLWCECECANCEIGAHERCHSPKCHMPKWKDVEGKTPKRDR